MKIECERCRQLVEVAAVVPTPAGIEIECPACAGTFAVPARTDAGAPVAVDAAVPRPPGPMRCPKCGDEQPEAVACRACGLAAAHFDAYARAREGEAAPGELLRHWERCQEHWDDPAAHERFLEAVSFEGSYAFAARRYRAVLGERPDDARAHAALQRLTRMAEARMVAQAAPRNLGANREEPYKNVVILLIVLVMLGGIGGIYTLLRSTSETERPAPAGVERR